MHALDQSHVNMDTTDMKKFDTDRNKRKELIKNNFIELIDYSSIDGFAEMGKLDVSGLDSCRNWAVFIPCFDIGQIEPQLFFGKETVKVLTKEIQEGRLKSSSLFSSFREGFSDHEFCESGRDVMLAALVTWGVEISDLPGIRFKVCSS